MKKQISTDNVIINSSTKTENLIHYLYWYEQGIFEEVKPSLRKIALLSALVNGFCSGLSVAPFAYFFGQEVGRTLNIQYATGIYFALTSTIPLGLMAGVSTHEIFLNIARELDVTSRKISANSWNLLTLLNRLSIFTGALILGLESYYLTQTGYSSWIGFWDLPLAIASGIGSFLINLWVLNEIACIMNFKVFHKIHSYFSVKTQKYMLYEQLEQTKRYLMHAVNNQIENIFSHVYQTQYSKNLLTVEKQLQLLEESNKYLYGFYHYSSIMSIKMSKSIIYYFMTFFGAILLISANYAAFPVGRDMTQSFWNLLSIPENWFLLTLNYVIASIAIITASFFVSYIGIDTFAWLYQYANDCCKTTIPAERTSCLNKLKAIFIFLLMLIFSISAATPNAGITWEHGNKNKFLLSAEVGLAFIGSLITNLFFLNSFIKTIQKNSSKQAKLFASIEIVQKKLSNLSEPVIVSIYDNFCFLNNGRNQIRPPISRLNTNEQFSLEETISLVNP